MHAAACIKITNRRVALVAASIPNNVHSSISFTLLDHCIGPPISDIQMVS